MHLQVLLRRGDLYYRGRIKDNVMASWLFGSVAKLKNDHITETKDTSPAPTLNPEPENNLPPTPYLPYNLQPVKEPEVLFNKSDQNVKQTSMLDNIPFVLSNQINVNSDNYNYNLEETKRFLLSVKENLESDVYNYNFSNDRRLVRDGTTQYVN